MFSLNWFTTIPGLLITGGVLLLVIALIIFIVTSKKEKKKNEGVANNNGNIGVTPNPNDAINQSVSVQPTSGTQPISVDSIPMQNAQPSAVENSPVIVPTVMNEPVSDNFSNANIGVSVDNLSVDQPLNDVSPVGPVANMASVGVSPVNNQEVMNETNGISPSVSEINSAPVMTPSMPEVQPVIVDSPVDNSIQGAIAEPVTVPTISEMPEVPMVSSNVNANVSEMVAPSVEQVVPELQDVSAPTISATDTYISPYNSGDFQSNPSVAPIYGGADPVVSDVVVNQESPQIYGGANPLEGTQSIPVTIPNNEVNTQQVSPIPTPTPVVDVTSPVVDQPAVIPTSVDSVSIPSVSVNSMPTVEPVVPNYTAQQPIDTNNQVNPINNNFNYQSATAPQVQLPTNGNVQ